MRNQTNVYRDAFSYCCVLTCYAGMLERIAVLTAQLNESKLELDRRGRASALVDQERTGSIAVVERLEAKLRAHEIESAHWKVAYDEQSEVQERIRVMQDQVGTSRIDWSGIRLRLAKLRMAACSYERVLNARPTFGAMWASSHRNYNPNANSSNMNGRPLSPSFKRSVSTAASILSEADQRCRLGESMMRRKRVLKSYRAPYHQQRVPY